MSMSSLLARVRAVSFGCLLACAVGPAAAQVMTVPLPGSTVVLGSLAFNAVMAPADSNITLFTNTRTATNSLGATVSTAARVSDMVLTNGGNTLCYVQLATLQGELVLAEVAVPASSSVVINLLNPVPVTTNNALRVVRSDLFAPACNSALVVSVRGYYTYVN